MTACQGPRTGEQQHERLGGEQRGLQPFSQPQQHGQDRAIADQRHQRDQRDAREAQVIGIAEKPQPFPARGRAGPRQVFADRQSPQRWKRIERDERRQDAGGIQSEGSQRGGKSDPRRGIEPARVELLDELLAAHGHSPVPRPSARAPATSSTAITTRRTTEAGVRASKRAPRRDPSITPRIAGTASAGRSAPRWIYTHAAELFTTEMTRPLVPTATLRGAAITKFSTGTLANPAPRPNTPPRNP